MDNQLPISPQVQTLQTPPIPTPPPVPKPSNKGATFKIIAGLSTVVVLCVVAWYGFRSSEVQNQNLSDTFQINTMSTLTAEGIKNLKIASNVGNDYFIGSTEEQNKIVDLFVEDNSASDSAYLYFAANTAHLLDRSQDALFLFFAAQLRKSFDYGRFGLGEVNGDNIETYLGYLNQGAGEGINPLAIQHPELFSKAIRMLEEWSVVPAEDAYYPKETYGEPKLSKDQWDAIAKEDKDSFLNEFAYKQEKMLSDPKILEALRYLQDYNFGKIAATPENDKKFQEYLELLSSLNE